MGSEKKGLFVHFEGLYETVIDSQVHMLAREMKERGIVDFEIWAFACFEELYERSLPKVEDAVKLSGCRVRVFKGVRPAVPFSCLLNAILLWMHLRKYKPEFDLVHARTEYAVAVCSYLKLQKKMNLIWDCRGDSQAESSGKFKGSSPLRKAMKWYQTLNNRWRIFLASKKCQRVIFVSQPLRRVVGRRLKNKPYEIIPSVASAKMFYFDEMLRKEKRARLGYATDEKVLIYSGGLAPYQCFPETVELFEKLYRRDDTFRLLVLMPHADKAKQYLQELPAGSYQVFSAKIHEVNAYLNAADYAVMLREHSAINSVASPTKFAEYCLTGLPVIMADSVPDSYALAKKNGNLCEYKNGDVAFTDVDNRQEIMERYRKLLSREAVIPSFQRVYLAESA